MFTTNAVRKSFTTSDGVTLSYLEAGEGQPFVMIPGWSQTALQWRAQIEAFSKTMRVIAVDMRGHGASDKPGIITKGCPSPASK
ncbi:MAG: alpha/beta hydrolase [Pseudomonadota bacterium]